MNIDFFKAATKAKTSKVIKCEKIQRTAERLSIREFEGEIRHCTVSKLHNGRYYVSILVNTTHVPCGKTVEMLTHLKIS